MIDLYELFEQWHLLKYPVGEYYFGSSSTDVDRYDRYSDGSYKDIRVAKDFAAFEAGWMLAKQMQ